jgi:hypothetical protein
MIVQELKPEKKGVRMGLPSKESFLKALATSSPPTRIDPMPGMH